MKDDGWRRVEGCVPKRKRPRLQSFKGYPERSRCIPAQAQPRIWSGIIARSEICRRACRKASSLSSHEKTI
jgi:hypothetical protein